MRRILFAFTAVLLVGTGPALAITDGGCICPSLPWGCHAFPY